MTPPRYQSLERRFFRLISQPRPLGTAADDWSHADPQLLPLAGWIQAPDEPAARARLGIYQHMYFARLRDSLREDFELVARLLPASSFDRIAESYLERYPSDNPSLRHHGRHFPHFLRDVLDEDLPRFPALRPDIADLARLEWGRIEAFDAPNCEALGREELLERAASGAGDPRLRSHPSLQLIETRFKVSTLWQAVESSQPPPEPTLGPELMLVWRRGFQVYHRAVAEREADALRELRQGTTLQALCGGLADPAASPEQCALGAFQILDQWLADELVARPDAVREREQSW